MRAWLGARGRVASIRSPWHGVRCCRGSGEFAYLRGRRTVSQMPEVTGGWPEEGAQYAPGAPMEPVQQAYPPQQPYQTQQQYQQQGYPEPQYHQQQAQQQYPAPQAQQQPYPQEQTAPQQAVFAEEEQSALPSEFDHLFRDSSPEDRRAISGKQPMVSGPGA